jgi:hypothetical protein
MLEMMDEYLIPDSVSDSIQGIYHMDYILVCMDMSFIVKFT